MLTRFFSLLALYIVIAALARPIAVEAQVILSPAAALGRPAQPLEIQQTIKREIRGGETHVYEISMVPGQYAQVRLDVKGPVDVVAKLITPSGQMVLQVFTAGRTYAPTMGYWVAETPGPYRIMLTPPRPPLDFDTYDITLEELRPATDKDRALVAAVIEWSVISSEGAQALMRQDAKAIVETHRKLLAQTEKLDKRDALYSIAYLLSYNMSLRLIEFKQPALAEAVLKDALAFFDRILGTKSFISAEMIALTSDFYAAQGRQSESRALLARLAELVESDLSNENPYRVALMHMRVGEFLFNERRYDLSVISLERARALLPQAEGFENMPTTQVRVLLDLGSALSISGSAARALVILDEAHAVLRKNSAILNADASKVRIDYIVGVSHMRLGDLEKAKPLIESAVADFAARTLTVATLRDRMMALSRLRIYQRKGSEALNLTLAASEILQETLPELRQLVTARNADYKPFVQQLIDEAPNEQNAKLLSNLLSTTR